MAQSPTSAGGTTSGTTKASAGDRRRMAVARAAEISGEVLTSVESGQRSALGAVHRFVDALDEALPAIGKHPERRDKVIDAALEMADRLVTSQYEFLRGVLRSVDRGQPAEKPAGKRAAKKASAKKATTKRTAAKKATAKRATAKKAATRKAAVKKAAVKKASAKKASAKKASAKKASAKKTASR